MALPKSETHFGVNLVGVLCFFASICLCRYMHGSLLLSTTVSMAATVMPIVVYDLVIVRVYQCSTAGFTSMLNIDRRRVAIKILGLIGSCGFIALIYWTVPEYRRPFYRLYYTLLTYVFPLLLIGAWYYFFIVDSRMQEPYDGYWYMGRFLASRGRFQNKNEQIVIAEFCRGWLIKGFFFPLMFMFLATNVDIFLNYNYAVLGTSFFNLYEFALTVLYSVDLAFASTGYIMTYRATNSHIRSTEPTLLGWLVTVICYPPLWGFISHSYLQYNDGYIWKRWLGDSPILGIVWGSLLVALIAIYAMATVALGIRFSNLTYRGLVTNGPYRFSKHPAYIAKNLSWWLIAIPFFPSSGYLEAIRMSLLLLMLNFIYFLRARTEENHLSNYPEYVEYANWINEHGVLRIIGTWFPALKYSQQRAQASRSIVWFKRLEA